MEIIYADEFAKQFRKLSKRIQQNAVKQEEVFRENPLHPSLNIEKLRPRSKELWSIRVDKKYRIIFRYTASTKSHVYFLAIGEHDFIYKFTNRL
ncbi:MAG: hypothetical protein RLZZ70_534 [Candidatus Parcubacteria bacterium]|jgi:mRNA-degrading endonuclease RelE of RelBE toxin-antitoxin system